MIDFNQFPSPCYIMEEELLRKNLCLIKSVADRAGVEIILAFKSFVFFFNDTATTEIYTALNTLSLHDASSDLVTENATVSHSHTHALEATGLKKHYGPRNVVKGVNLAVKSGEVVGLLGKNGAGKTTTFYMVVGLVVADDGQIRLDGQDITHMPIYKRARMGLSYLPQEASVFRKLSVEDNVRAILELQEGEDGKPLSKDVIEERLDQLLEELQIQHLRTNQAISLSGGERRRTEIARALAAYQIGRAHV